MKDKRTLRLLKKRVMKKCQKDTDRESSQTTEKNMRERGRDDWRVGAGGESVKRLTRQKKK